VAISDFIELYRVWCWYVSYRSAWDVGWTVWALITCRGHCIQASSGYSRHFWRMGLKWLWYEACYLPISGVEVKNVWACIPYFPVFPQYPVWLKTHGGLGNTQRQAQELISGPCLGAEG
jgi:hypothetical protein